MMELEIAVVLQDISSILTLLIVLKFVGMADYFIGNVTMVIVKMEMDALLTVRWRRTIVVSEVTTALLQFVS